jgi:radical SAM protein with 4Fe4S-binding SPASM domain
MATVKSGLNRLIISVDGTDQTSYSTYRIGGNLEKVVEGVKALSEAKRASGSQTPLIIIQFLALKSNQHQIREIKKKGLEWGGDKVTVKTAQFYSFIHGNPLMPGDKKYSRYKQERDKKPGYGGNRHSQKSPDERNEKESRQQFSYSIKNSLPRHCFRMWSSCVITWDGNVVPCCFDKNAGAAFGNLKNKSFMEIWRSRTYKDFRRMILEKREKIEICANCTEGTGFSRWF